MTKSESKTANDKFFVYRDGAILLHRFSTHEAALKAAKDWCAGGSGDNYFVGKITETVVAENRSRVRVMK
jgi:hypothetical protein